MTSIEANKTRVGVISDDLTSALESAGAFAQRGLESHVSLSTDRTDHLLHMPCVAIDAATRCVDRQIARGRIEAGITTVRDRSILVKTMDSTLRGHVSLEIEAALTAANRYVAVVAPAFPAEGRTTVGGTQYLGGVPVSRTAFRNDPVWPVTESDICKILGHGALDVVESIGDAVAETLAERVAALSKARKWSALVVDATTQEHLACLSSAIDKPEQVIWVGSPGLLLALAERLRPTAGFLPVPALRKDTRIVVAVGSVHPVAREQLLALQSARGVPIAVISTDHAVGDPRRAAEEAMGALSASELHAPIIAVTTTRPAHGQRVSSGRFDRPDGISSSLAQAIGLAVLGLSRRRGPTCYVLTGGDTALVVSRQLGIRSLRLVGMMEPGIPVAALDRTREIMIAKAGGFGDRDLLIRACDYVGRIPRDQSPRLQDTVRGGRSR